MKHFMFFGIIKFEIVLFPRWLGEVRRGRRKYYVVWLWTLCQGKFQNLGRIL